MGSLRCRGGQPHPGGGGELKARTGIEALDRRLAGGFDRPSCLLFFSENMAEKRIFAEQFVIAGIRSGEVCLYVDFYRAPQLARREFHKFGAFDENRLVIVDSTSVQTMVESQEKYRLRDPEDLDHIEEVLLRALQESRAARAVVDSLEYITERFPRERAMEFLSRLISQANKQNTSLALLFINWTYGPEELASIRAMVNYVVEFKTNLKGGILLNTLRVKENREKGLSTNWIPFTFRDMLGLVIYFPKILVTGPHGAGKSTLIRKLARTSVSVDRLGTTVAFDYGNVEVAGVEAELFGTPGQERFEFIFKIFAQEVNGLLLVVDSSDPASFERARQMRKLAGEHLPMVVAANKMDLPGALSLGEVQAGLGFGPSVPVVPTAAANGEGIEEALKTLVDLVVSGGP